jgi:hypothetical protein
MQEFYARGITFSSGCRNGAASKAGHEIEVRRHEARVAGSVPPPEVVPGDDPTADDLDCRGN